MVSLRIGGVHYFLSVIGSGFVFNVAGRSIAMKWHFGNDGEWIAWSKAKDACVYRIQVCEDGTFDISKSDDGLVRQVDAFQRLRNAQAFCEQEEKVHLESVR